MVVSIQTLMMVNGDQSMCWLSEFSDDFAILMTAVIEIQIWQKENKTPPRVSLKFTILSKIIS